jgi:hypothetical protein
MKGFSAIILIVLVAALLMGMGGLGGEPEGTVPETDENIQARVLDRSGVMTELTRFSMDGKVFLTGQRGSGEITVFFKNILELDFNKVVGEHIPAKLQLQSGEVLDLEVKKRAVFYGDTGYGAFQIRARDVKKIEFPRSPG